MGGITERARQYSRVWIANRHGERYVRCGRRKSLPPDSSWIEIAFTGQNSQQHPTAQ
jgi:hypothetical protein